MILLVHDGHQVTCRNQVAIDIETMELHPLARIKYLEMAGIIQRLVSCESTTVVAVIHPGIV